MANKTFPFNPVTDIPSLAGKVILITGANSGLGKRAALDLVPHGPAKIYLTARDAAKTAATVDEIRAVAPTGTEVHGLEMDLTSFESIKATARAFVASSDRLDLLYLNAGIMGIPAAQTAEGYEIQIGTNHVGHALLLQLLTPTLKKTAAASAGEKPRIINVASLGYRYLDPPVVHIDQFKTPEAGHTALMRYCQSKLVNVLYARQFAVHHPDLMIVAIHPGEALTGLFSREPADERVKQLQSVQAVQHATTVEECVKNHLWSGTVSEDKLVSGDYYEPVGEAGRTEPIGKDDDVAKKIWDWTEKELEGHSL